ncbi:MAG: DUF3108 domain-containing protein [Gemmatimonadota bacterium]|nr:DUF3108 domain-containing protein [Gemmatimonadota bacterium]
MRRAAALPAGLLAAPLLLAASTFAGAAATSAPRAAPQARPAPASAPADTLAAWRFPVGERMEYSVTWAGLRLGTGALTVEGLDTLDAGPAWRVALTLEGGPPFYRIDDRMTTWIRADSAFGSLRFEQRQREGSYRRHRRIEIDPAARIYTRYDRKDGEWVRHGTEADVPTPPGALDEIAFIYFARLLPLEPGRRYEFHRYFKEAGNPVTLEVLRREQIRVPAGRFDVVVVRPGIRERGMFAEGGEAEIYLTDDARRIPVRVKAAMPVGSAEFFLTGYEPGGAPGSEPGSPPGGVPGGVPEGGTGR